MAESLQVSGGAGGLEANLDDLRRYADIADGIGEVLADASRQLAQLAASPAISLTTPLSPTTAGRAQATALSASAQIRWSQGRLRANSFTLRRTADLVQGADRFRDASASTWSLFRLGNAVVGEAGYSIWALPANLLRESTASVRTLWNDGFAAFGAAVWEAPGNAVRRSVDAERWRDLMLDHPVATDVAVSSLVTVRSLLTGRSLSFADTARDLTAIGSTFGYFQDSRIRVTRTEHGELTPRDVARTTVPTSLYDLMSNQQAIHGAARADELGSRIRIIEVPGEPTSSWIVQVPGTQEWSPQGGSNPSDLTTNLHLSGRQQAALLEAIDEALRAAGIGSDPVMISGHSQGGIAAATFANQASSRGYNVTHVVTAGSPIAHVSIPSSIQVLAIEHHNDPVPRLDGATNPTTANITTVVADLGGSGVFDSVAAPHSSELYTRTADQIDRSDDPSVRTFLTSAERFFSGPPLGGQQALESQLITDYRLHRPSP